MNEELDVCLSRIASNVSGMLQLMTGERAKKDEPRPERGWASSFHDGEIFRSVTSKRGKHIRSEENNRGQHLNTLRWEWVRNRPCEGYSKQLPAATIS